MFGAVSTSLLLDKNKFTQLMLPLDLQPEYTLNPDYFTSIQTGFTSLAHNSLTKTTIIEDEDHPGFAKLRNRLERKGYINAVRVSVNGDTVLKPFILNGKQFDIGDRFLCAVAMKYKFKE